MSKAEKVSKELGVFLKEVRLINYKSISKAETNFKPGLNIIIGNNGSGKTNFLDYLNLVLGFDFEKINGYNAEFTLVGQKDYKFIVRDSLLNWLIPKNSTQEKTTRIQLDIGSQYKTFDSPNDSKFISERESINYSSYFLKYGSPLMQLIINQPASITYTFNNLNPQISEFSDESLFSVSIYSRIIFLLTQIEIEDFKDEGIIKRKIEKGIKELLVNLSAELSTYTDIKEIRLFPGFRVDINQENKKVDLKYIYIEFRVNQNWTTYDKLSDGTKRVFYLISETTSYLQSEIFDKLSSKRKRIVLLEEPELGIHPHQLHKLMLFIKEQSKEKQIILTTHSPQVLNILDADELDRIIICSYDQQKGTQLRHLTEKETQKARLYMQEDFLSDYWIHSDLEPVI